MKRIFIIVLLGLLSLFTPSYIQAVPEIYVGLENPSSPTSKDKFNLSFTVLDMMGRPLTVKCYKINPDNSEIQIGADVAVKAGGNSGNCSLENNPLTESGKTYNFYAVAFAGGDSSTSEKVSVEYDNVSPGTPSEYGKEKVGVCNYKISFRASNDGRTTKIKIYRADITKFIADSGSQIGEVGISPDQKGDYTDVNVPDCNKTYYYVVRAFDSTGNGSGLVGDSVTVTTNTTTNVVTNPVAGAIALSGASNISQENIGETANQPEIKPTNTAESSESGTVLGAKDTDLSFFDIYKLPIILSVLIMLSLIGYGIKKVKKQK